MNELKNIFDSLYTRFVLRDFFAKIVPGAFCLLTFAVFFESPSTTLSYLSSLSFWYWLLIIGLAWLLGIVLQNFGHLVHIIEYDPPQEEREDYYINRRLPFGKIATDEEKQRYERFVVLKEASGNGAIALAISCAIIIFGFIFDKYIEEIPSLNWIFHSNGYAFLVIILIGFAALCLYLGYRQFKERQHNYMDIVLKYHHATDAQSKWLDY